MLVPRVARTLTFAFNVPVPGDPWLNRATAWISRHPVCHVELFFETVNQCFSIMLGEPAGLRIRNLSNPNYRILSITVSQQEYETCLSFCQSATNWGLTFDDHAMLRSVYAPGCCEPTSQAAGKTFCSKIITEALQYAGIPEFEHLNPALTTPSRLYQTISCSPRLVCSTVPFKRDLLTRASLNSMLA